MKYNIKINVNTLSWKWQSNCKQDFPSTATICFIQFLLLLLLLLLLNIFRICYTFLFCVICDAHKKKSIRIIVGGCCVIDPECYIHFFSSNFYFFLYWNEKSDIWINQWKLIWEFFAKSLLRDFSNKCI